MPLKTETHQLTTKKLKGFDISSYKTNVTNEIIELMFAKLILSKELMELLLDCGDIFIECKS